MIDLYTSSTLLFLNIVGSTLGVSLALQLISGIFLLTKYSFLISDVFIALEYSRISSFLGRFMFNLHRSGASLVFSLFFPHYSRSALLIFPGTFTWITGVFMFTISIFTMVSGYILSKSVLSDALFSMVSRLLPVLPHPFKHFNLIIKSSSLLLDNLDNTGVVFLLHVVLAIITIILITLHLSILHDAGSRNISLDDLADLFDFDPYLADWDEDSWSCFDIILDSICSICPNLFEDIMHLSYKSASIIFNSASIPHWYVLWLYGPLTAISDLDPSFTLFPAWFLYIFGRITYFLEENQDRAKFDWINSCLLIFPFIVLTLHEFSYYVPHLALLLVIIIIFS